MTDVNDIISDGTDGLGDSPAGSGHPPGRATSGPAEAETVSGPQGSTSTDSPESVDAPNAEVVEEDLDELSAALAERDEYKDLALRAKADFENYRKRADKRVAETRTVAIAGVLRELLPVVDNLDRAVEATGGSGGGDAFADGVRLVHADLHAVLDRLGLTPIDPTGEQFDPNFHEAISQAPATPEQAAGTVIDVVQKGFQLGEIVVRPARVVVAA
jgi:molecular chaperone GrpE